MAAISTITPINGNPINQVRDLALKLKNNAIAPMKWFGCRRLNCGRHFIKKVAAFGLLVLKNLTFRTLMISHAGVNAFMRKKGGSFRFEKTRI
jgi:hypothetical protein